MKRNLIIFTFLLTVFTLYSCEQAVDPLKDKGTIFIDSEPEEASIYVDGKSSGLFTPGEVEVVSGIHIITLKKIGYADFNFTDTVTVGAEKIHPEIKLSKYGKIIINSEPDNAKIYIDDANTLETTPHTFSKPDDIYTITLKYEKYADSTFNVIIKDAKDVEFDVNLRGEFLSNYGGRVLYDTTNSTANEPSGLSLSSGEVLNISPNSGQKAIADLIFVPNQYGGYEIRTPNGTNGMARDTRFLVSKSDNINDHNNSPIEDPSWRNSFPSTTNNYVFAYDSDGHYSKIMIVKRSENPMRVELRWIYNDNAFDSSF